MPDKDSPTFRDLYEIAERSDARLEKLGDRVSRTEKVVIGLTCMVGYYILGEPAADVEKVVALVRTWLV